ncbi:MAG: KH domain-containing protein [Myxococcales bacterium]|nr:KH domain-containing protein [Myxococcales bacterium]
MVDVERAQSVLVDLLAKMGFDAKVEVHEDEERITLEVKTPDSALIIGKKGQTLDALQTLMLLLLRQEDAEAAARAGKPVVVDAEGYRARRIDTLVDMATRLAAKALASNRAVELEQMSAYDRRIVHGAVGAIAGVTSRSEGDGKDRRLLIVPDPTKVV